MGVSPPRLEFEVEQRTRTQSVKVFNFSDEAVKVRVSIFNWTLDEHNEVRIQPPTEQSLDQWMFVNPLEFTIPARQQQTVRFGVRPRTQPISGEHRAIIYFDSEPAEKPDGAVAVLGRMGIAAYGYVGEITRIGVLNDITIENTVKPIKAVFDITSKGNAHVSACRVNMLFGPWSSSLVFSRQRPYPICKTLKLVKICQAQFWQRVPCQRYPYYPTLAAKFLCNYKKLSHLASTYSILMARWVKLL